MSAVPLRREVVNIVLQTNSVKESTKSITELLQKLKSLKNISESELQEKSRHFCSKVHTLWKNCYRNRDRFFKRHESWLNEPVLEPKYENTTSNGSGGRPEVPFGEGSERTKRRKVQKLREEVSTEMLGYSAQMNLRSEKKTDAAVLMKEIISSSPAQISEMRSVLNNKAKSSRSVTPYTENEALALFLDGDMSQQTYQDIRSGAKARNCNLYPSYKKLQIAKQNCYPKSLSFTDTRGVVKLQELLDHTAERVVQLAAEEIAGEASSEGVDLEMLSKWGCDGSSGQSIYKQGFAGEQGSDSHMFVTSLVPLQVRLTSRSTAVMWQNPAPSSTHFCRPIRLQFMKETAASTIDEKAYIDSQINDLLPTKFFLRDVEVRVTHKLMFTMIDQKVCNSVSGTSSVVCYICGAKPTEMNKIDDVLKKEVQSSTYEFGLSTLHAWIRCMEFILHLSYRLEIKKWRVTGPAEKKAVEERQKFIQSEFHQKLNFKPDIPIPGGSGTSNDGNMARRFFKDPHMTSSITGVNLELISRLGIILSVLSSGKSIHVAKFETFCLQTARLSVAEYQWFYLPPSVHKLLVHSPHIISTAMLPIGLLSEEAQEGLNKFFRRFRERHARKCSRASNMEDVFKRLLESSDPVISNLRRARVSSRRNKETEMTAEMKDLILNPDSSESESSSDELPSE